MKLNKRPPRVRYYAEYLHNLAGKFITAKFSTGCLAYRLKTRRTDIWCRSSPSRTKFGAQLFQSPATRRHIHLDPTGLPYHILFSMYLPLLLIYLLFCTPSFAAGNIDSPVEEMCLRRVVKSSFWNCQRSHR